MNELLNIIIIGLIILSIITILSKKIENTIISMISIFLLSGGLFIYIGLSYIGFIYWLIYTAAISILFLFVIMMIDLRNEKEIKNKKLWNWIIMSILTIYIWKKIYNDLERNISNNWIYYHEEWDIQKLDLIQGIGYILYTEHIVLLILLIIILLYVMIGIIKNHK